MPQLSSYKAFAGRHWETGSVANILQHQGPKLRHNGKAASEALLLGISGGITFGYFTFHYEGYDPQINLLTRNTFDPLTTLLDRLAIPRDVRQTTSPDKAQVNLVEVLESGSPALVWADAFSLPYNHWGYDEMAWAMWPVVVYGCEDNAVLIADRSSKGLRVPLEQFNAARARVKKDKFRLMTLDGLDPDVLPSAVQKGIWQCISLYTEAPPKGAKHNFGLAALQHWAKMLTNTRNKASWSRYFPPGAGLYAALLGRAAQPGTLGWIQHWGSAGGAERGLYADFLDEAAAILDKADLKDAAKTFRKSKAAWDGLATLLVPAGCSILEVARDLLNQRHDLFVKQGDTALDEIASIDARIAEIRGAVDADFPLTEAEITELQARLADQVLVIHDIEAEAVQLMQAAMS